MQDLQMEISKKMDSQVRHSQLIDNQFRVYSDVQRKLNKGDVILISDYSDNWTIKYPIEAQSMHFHEHQVVILTVVATLRKEEKLIDEIHLFLSERIDKINENIKSVMKLFSRILRKDKVKR